MTDRVALSALPTSKQTACAVSVGEESMGGTNIHFIPANTVNSEVSKRKRKKGRWKTRGEAGAAWGWRVAYLVQLLEREQLQVLFRFIEQRQKTG